MLFVARITQKYDHKNLIYVKLKNTAKQMHLRQILQKSKTLV